MKVGKFKTSSNESARLQELRKKQSETRKRNYINIRNRPLRLNLKDSMTPQKIEQMRMFLCVNKNSLFSLYEKHKKTLKEIGNPMGYRHPYASLLLDLTKNKNKVQGTNHINFFTWQANRLKISKSAPNLNNSTLFNSCQSFSFFIYLDSFNGNDIICKIEKLNNQALNPPPQTQNLNDVQKLVQFVYREAPPVFGFSEPLDL